jgi:hypothetical protein
MGTLHEDHYTFFNQISRISYNEKCFRQSCRENQNTRHMFSNVFFYPQKIMPLWDNVVKYGRAGHTTDYSVVHVNCMLDT